MASLLPPGTDGSHSRHEEGRTLMVDPALLAPEFVATGDALAARIEEAGLNAVQPPEQLLYDGWLLRHCPGKARRARSVNAIADGRIELQAKIDHCRAFYAQASLPCLFRITPFSRPSGLDAALACQGFTAAEETRVMTLALAEGGRVVAVGQSVQESDLVGLYDIVSAEDTRNRGLATALTTELLRRALEERAAVAYLQVSADNIAARHVYRKLGFVDRYAYWYRIEPVVTEPLAT